LVVSLAVSAGCARPPVHDPGTPIEDQALARSLRSALADMYPASFSAVHRTILTVRGRQSEMIGAALVERSFGVRLLAMGDMGGTAFDVVSLADGSARVERNPAGLRERWLREGAARDAFALYLAGPSPRAGLVRHESGAPGLVEDLPDGTRREFRFDPAGRRLAEYLVSRGGRCLYRAEHSNFKTVAPWTQPVPGTVRATDYRLNYAAVIEVTGLRPQAVDRKAFEAGRPGNER
jgi:hypothetical protein